MNERVNLVTSDLLPTLKGEAFSCVKALSVDKTNITSPEKLRERIILLRRFLSHLEWDLPNEVKDKVNKEVFKGELPVDKRIDIQDLARKITDGQLESMIRLSPLKDYYTFRGRYYTVRRGGIFEPLGS